MFNETISEIKGEQLILGLFLMHILLSGVLFLTTMSEPRVKDDTLSYRPIAGRKTKGYCKYLLCSKYESFKNKNLFLIHCLHQPWHQITFYNSRLKLALLKIVKRVSFWLL